jgi:transcription antitermination factor NusG
MTPLWHVCHVAPQSERAVAKDIDAAKGYRALLPMERFWRTRRGRRIVAERPLFTGYVFAQVDHATQPWQALLDLDGVLGVLGRPGDNRPGIVPAAWIDMIVKMQDCGVFDRTRPEPDKFKIGDLVRVSEGPMAGLAGKVEGFAAKFRSATAKKRVKLMMDFLGRIEVDVTAIEPIPASGPSAVPPSPEPRWRRTASAARYGD